MPAPPPGFSGTAVRGAACASRAAAGDSHPCACMLRRTWLRRAMTACGRRYGMSRLGEWIMPARVAAWAAVSWSGFTPK